ncbi:hypothetical protein [Actinoplanes palleronii]|uniref:hypothetical protein n=1 Tax=Actinoplanes palleronii TaxID=113570 RepID=UPI0019439A0B|nr:hypothetical protein [Actinoplanes palleronii]
MPHLPDDDGFEPPLKVLRKRINGVYREDHGFSGPTRRYLLMVVMLVGLASVPTLAVITAGTSEIAHNGRKDAMDAPFLPPAASGPVRPATPPKNPFGYDDPSVAPSDSDTEPAKPPGVSTPRPPSTGAPRMPEVPGLPRVPDDPPRPAPTRSDVDPRGGSTDGGVSRPAPATVFPTVPGLPEVPDEDWNDSLARRAPRVSGAFLASPGRPDPDSDHSPSDKPDSSDNADLSNDCADNDSTSTDRSTGGPTPAGGQQ